MDIVKFETVESKILYKRGPGRASAGMVIEEKNTAEVKMFRASRLPPQGIPCLEIQ